MTHISHDHPLVLTFVGMAGSGKSSCIDYLKEKGYPSVYFGGITVEETKRRGLELNEQNEKMVREDLRATEGPDVMAKRIAQQIKKLAEAGQTRIIADGLYSWTEYKYFKKHFGNNAVVIAVAAPRALRHERLTHRKVRPFTPEQAALRDYNEIEGIEKGGPIANADYTLVNNKGLTYLYSQLEEVLQAIIFYKH